MSHLFSRPLSAPGPAAFVVLAGALVIGCDARRGTTGGGSKPPTTAGDADVAALAGLDSQADLAHCRTVLQRLDAGEGAGSRPTLSEPERAELAALFRPTPAELSELGQPTFSQTDAAYLEECLLVRAGMRALRIDGRPPLERARLAFEWVCRQVYIDQRVPWPGNPWTTLQGGAGVPLGRAYVVLAAWQQLGLDGCLVGPPELKTARSATLSDGRPQYAPVRACGVQIDGDLFLFDPAGGRPLTAADGKGVLSLANAQRAPDAVRGFDAAEVKTWVPYISPPLPALSRRMEWLDQRNPGNTGVKLYVNAAAQRARFGPGCQGWNVEGDEFSAPRVLAKYATDEGAPPYKLPVRDHHRMLMSPADRLPRNLIDGPAFNQLVVTFLRQFEALRFGPNTPRDLMLRGRYPEATSDLEDKKNMVDNARARMEEDKGLQKDFQAWAEELQRLAARTLRPEPGDPGGAQAAKALEQFRAAPKNRDVERAYILGYAARPLAAEVAFLTAQCVHERAERLQLDGSPQAAAHWRNAAEWWQRFLDASVRAQSPFPAREPHARSLLARCQQFAGK